MNVVFVPEARDEFLDAIAFYEEARCGLGERFKGEIDRCILWIAGHNELYRIRPSGYQRINLRTFPSIPHRFHNEKFDPLGIGCGAQLSKT